VRELQNVIERATVLSQGAPIGIGHLPREMTEATAMPPTPGTPAFHSMELNPAVEKLEEAMIREALNQTGGNKTKAARLLEISERSLWYKLKKLNIE
jgi:two-component system response regulator AtoC